MDKMDGYDGYRRVMDKIEPSGELLERTRLKMNAAQTQTPRRRWLLAIPAMAAVVALAVMVFAFILPSRRILAFRADSLSILPTSQSGELVGVDTDFIITSDSGVLPSADAMKELISILPERDFSLEKQDGGYLLTTGGDFDEGSLIRLTVASGDGSEKRWTFQTDEAFRVKSVFPADGAGYVELNAGIEVELAGGDVTVESFTKALSITPDISGQVVKRGVLFTFIPDGGLDGFTEYSVAIDASLASVSGDTLGESFVFSFTTTPYGELSGEKGRISNSSDVSESYLVGDLPVIRYYSYGDASDEGVGVTVWRYESADAYKKALEAYAAAQNAGQTPVIDTAGLTKVMSFSTDTNINGDQFRYAVFPEPLEKGWYAARVTANDGYGGECSFIKLIQVSDVSVYALDTGADNVFWLNSAASGETLVSAGISLERGGEKVSGKTGSDGVANVARPGGDAKNGLLDIDSSAGRYLTLWQFAADDADISESYYSYLYSDRPIYRRSDTVSFWGVIRPRTGGELPRQVRVTLGNWENTFISRDVELAADGSFSGKLSFDGLSGWLTLSVEIDGEVAYSRYVEALDYDKPVYSIELEPDKKVCFAGEEITASVSVSFFDGTPASGVQLEAYISRDERDAVRFTTDEYGAATVTLKASAEGSNEWYPVNASFSVRVCGAENELTECEEMIWIMPRDIALYGRFDAKSNRLDVYTDKLDLSGFTGGDSIYRDNYAAVRGGAAETKVYGYLYRVWYTKEQTGSYYDFAQKKTVRSYNYVEHKQQLKTYKFQTEGGHDYIDGLPRAEEGESYYVLLSATDSQGRTVTSTVRIFDSEDHYNVRGHLFRYDRLNAEDEYRFKDGETVELQLCDNATPVREGRMLSITASAHGTEYVVGGTTVSIPYSESNVPNFMVYGAWFDGRHVYAPQPMYLNFDPAQRALNIEIGGDESGSPGGDAQLSVLVSDVGGKPIANASGVLMLVDEAVFSVCEQEPEILDTLYRAVYFNGGWRTYVSYNDYLSAVDGGRGGGGGGGGVRKDFRDTAGAYIFTTDSDGRAAVTARLPDNVTSWRVTAIAAGTGSGGILTAGDSSRSLASGLDFFVTQIMPEEIIAGDDLTVSLRSYGDALSDREHTVDYTCTLRSAHRPSLSNPGSDITLKTSGRAGGYVSFSFQKPSAGEYTVTITAKCGELSDALELPLKVLESAVEAPVTRDIAPEDIPSIAPAKYPVTLCVYNAEARLQGRIVSRTLLSDGYRADQRLARAWLDGAPEALSGVDDLLLANGIRTYPYAERDPMLTAQLLTALGDSLDFSDMSGYFRSVLSDVSAASGDVAAAYLGLAASGQPVLADIRSLISDEKSFTLRDRLIFTAALAVLGDDDGALARFNELTDGLVVTVKNSDGLDESCVTLRGFSEEETLRLTSAAALTASLLHTPQEDAFAEYLASHNTRTDITLCAQLCYLAHLVPSKGAARATYMLNGSVQTAQLESRGVPLTLSLDREQLETLQLRCVSGKLLVTVRYYGGIDEVLRQKPSGLNVEKSYSGSGSYSVGDKAAVTVNVSGSALTGESCCGGVAVVEHLPAGMRFFALDEESRSLGWRVEKEEGQRVRFVWFPEREEQSPPQLSYTAVCVGAGSYISESAYATAPAAGDVWGLSERGSVTISKSAPSGHGE